jgi:hypothetical protein
MKLAGLLLLMLALAFGGDRPCTHAMSAGADGAQMHAASHQAAPVGHDHGHGADGSSHAPMPDHEGHCPDGCDGGADCVGCHSLAAATVAFLWMGASTPPSAAHALVAKEAAQPLATLDPPVPKPFLLT